MIETPRIILRPIAPHDREAIFSYRSDAETNQYQSWVPKTIEEVDQFIAKNPASFNQPETWFQLVISEQETNAIIGDMGVHFIDDYQVEIGFTLSKEKQGKGFATESVKALINYLFETLNKHRIIASIDPANTNSIRLLERVGFRKEAHFKQSLLINNQWVDDVIYGLLKSEWN